MGQSEAVFDHAESRPRAESRQRRNEEMQRQALETQWLVQEVRALLLGLWELTSLHGVVWLEDVERSDAGETVEMLSGTEASRQIARQADC